MPHFGRLQIGRLLSSPTSYPSPKDRFRVRSAVSLEEETAEQKKTRFRKNSATLDFNPSISDLNPSGPALAVEHGFHGTNSRHLTVHPTNTPGFLDACNKKACARQKNFLDQKAVNMGASTLLIINLKSQTLHFSPENAKKTTLNNDCFGVAPTKLMPNPSHDVRSRSIPRIIPTQQVDDAKDVP